MKPKTVGLPRLARTVRVAFVRFGLIGTALLLAFGCGRLMTSIPAGAEPGKLKSFFVIRHERDGRGINELIRDDLATRGVTATTGLDSALRTTVDAIVTYDDHWKWDITMYMFALEIIVRDGTSNVLLASGLYFNPSVGRKEPRMLVKLVLDEIFKAAR